MSVFARRFEFLLYAVEDTPHFGLLLGQSIKIRANDNNRR